MFSPRHNSIQSFKSCAYADTVKPILDGDSDYTSSLCTNAPKPFIFLIWIDVKSISRQICCPKLCLDFIWSLMNFVQVDRYPSQVFHIVVFDEIRQNPLEYMLSPEHNSVQLFKSCGGARMIKSILVMLYDLLGWCFLKIFQPPLLSSSSCYLKNKANHVLGRSFSNGSILNTLHELLNLNVLLIPKGFYPKSPQPQENLVSHVEPAWRASHVEPTRRRRVIDGFKFICSARSIRNVFTIQTWIIYINIVACKCVNNQSTTLNGINLPKYGSMVIKYFSAIAKMKGKVY